MDLLTAVATSMLGVSRLKAAAVFKSLSQSRSARRPLELVLDGLGVPAPRGGSAGAIGDRRRLQRRFAKRPDARNRLSFRCSTRDIRPCSPARMIHRRCCGRADAWRSRPSRAVAIIGSRAATPYALQVGRRLAAELAERGMVVVSGLARGVDSAAHAGCLDAGGETVAVLGSGLDRIYPAEHERLAETDLRLKGSCLSELAPGARTARGAFSAAQPHHQRDLFGHCGGRSL